MNFRPKQSGRGGVGALIDMTPLIDIVFLLLIFFLITTTFVRQQEMVITINLPEGEGTSQSTEAEQLTIYVESDGSYSILTADSDEPYIVSREALDVELQTFYDTDPEISVYLRGDREVDYGAVIDVLLLARQIGFERVQAVIQSDSGGLTPVAP